MLLMANQFDRYRREDGVWKFAEIRIEVQAVGRFEPGWLGIGLARPYLRRLVSGAPIGHGKRSPHAVQATAVASISISRSGKARRETPSSVPAGWTPARPMRSPTTCAPSAKKRSTSVT
jgi:hypothetical protein